MSLKHLTNVKTNWIKVRDVHTACFVGKEALAMGMGCHILLMNVATKAESFYRATDRTSGEGVACLTGHKSFSLYAFAESSVHPRIFVISYPENSIMFILEGDGKAFSYVALCFSDSEYLIAVNGVPDYSIEVYVWRSKEMLIKRKTGIHTEKQRISCSPASSLTMCQLAYNNAQVTLWEIHGNVKICRLIEKNIKLPFGKEDAPLDGSFSIDGTLMIINNRGSVFSFSATSGQLNQLIKPCEEPGTFAPRIFYCKGGLFLSDPDGSISFYKRQKGTWNQLWNTKPPEQYSRLLHYSASDGLFGSTMNGNLVRTLVDNDVRNVDFVPIKEFDCQITDFIVLNPLGESVIATNSVNDIIVLEVKSGVRLATYSIDQMRHIQENPLYPFVAVGTCTGILHLLSLHRPEEPTLLTDFHLGHAAITTIRFSDDGAYIAAFDEDRNMFFIKGLPGNTMDVIHHFEASIALLQPSFHICDNSMHIVGLLSDEFESNREVMKITISLMDGSRQIDCQELPKKYTQFERKPNSACRFYATSYLSTEIDIIEFSINEDGHLKVKICSSFRVKHQVSYFQIYVDQFHLITWSIDGLVTIYESKSDKLLAFFSAHDRTRMGIQRARCDSMHQYIVTLGHTGCLVCTKMHRSSVNAQRYNDLKLSLETDDVMGMFLNPTTGFSPKGFTFTRWIDMEKISRLESEKLDFEPKKLRIVKDFKLIKVKLRDLLDANEVATEDQQLPIHAFNLNAVITEKLKEVAKFEREEEHRSLLAYIVSQQMINKKIIQKCWEVMERKPVKVRSIFTKLVVGNYPSLPNERDEEFLKKMTVYRETELMASHDALLPWKPTPTYQLESILNRDPDYGNVIDVLSRAAAKKYYTLTGTTTHLYVEPMPLRFEQLEVVTFEQLYFEKVYGNIEMLKLRDSFNKKFDALKTLKDNEMVVVLKRNNRLRVIQQELSTMCKLLDSGDFRVTAIIDPRFQPDEIPDSIVRTENHEISVAPYLTPSMENFLAQEKAERERRQQELMADDFKDRALMIMMDGVLEHRWEDEIKKTPPIPHCLETGKDPQYYNETDIREVKEYEEQLRFLYNERMRYKKNLEVEKVQILDNLEDQIKKFNTRVGECLLDKICIESAIREEEMRILRNTFYNHQRLIYDRNANLLRDGIDLNIKHIDELTETMCELQDKVNDYKNTYEALSTKDRMLDKQFKINFSDTAQSAIVDQAYKIFKRRPKAQLRAVVTVSIFQDLAKRIMAKKSTQQSNMLLPQECVDYLSACEGLDQVANCPAGMDNNMWQTLCKMRRIKMESEFKLKSCEIQLADSEAALNSFQKEISSKKNALMALETKLQDLLDEKFEDSTNRNVQIVMKRGLIEVPMSGKMADFNSCILIHRTDVDDINVVIKRAGAKKLKAMVNAALFRRRIIAQEWDHKALRLRIRDLKDQVKMIEKCKITKEVQEWLKRKEMGTVEDLGQLALEREIENTIYAQEKMIHEIQKSVEELEEKIIVKRKENKLHDKKTQELNVDVTEQHLQKDSEVEETEEKAIQARMVAIVDRARFVRLVQAQHSQILELGTMLELQRLKTYPTLTAPSALGDFNARHLKA